MKHSPFMIYKEVLEKRLNRKREELVALENQTEGLATAQDKRKYIELKAVINELENCIDIADSIQKLDG